jgi:hypothetical protein
MSSRRRERGNFKFPCSRAIRNVWLWSIIRDKNFFVSWDYRGDSYAGKSCPFLQETNQKKVFTLVMPSSQHRSPTLSNLTKLGSIVHSITLRSLICSYWRTKNSYSISSFVTTRQIETPYSSPCKYDHPNDVPVGKKIVHEKSLGQNCINSFLAHKLSHNCWLLWFYVEEPYRRLPSSTRINSSVCLSVRLSVCLYMPAD